MTGTVVLDAWSLERLHEHPLNAKQHPPQQVQGIALSIQQFGFNDPIGVKPDGEIVEGHGRYQAARSLGMAEVPVLVISGLTEDQYRKYRIAHNKLTQQTGMLLSRVSAQISEIMKEAGVALESLGFSDDKLETIVSQLNRQIPTNRGGSSASVASRFEIIFDDADQRRDWNAWMRRQQTLHHKDATKADVFLAFVEQSGILRRSRA